jgi:hypothetical protein
MYLLQIVFGSMLIVAWVMSDPVNCELMGRLVSTAFRLSRDDIRLLVRLDLIAFCP